MRSSETRIVGAVAAVVIAVVLMFINARDHSRDPATDTADVVATAAVFGGALVWMVVRLSGASARAATIVRALAGGVAVGAAVIGLASVIYDPWAS